MWQVVLSQWVTAQYLSPRVRLQVQAQMERHSEVSLQDLLQPGTLADLMRALGDPGGCSTSLYNNNTKIYDLRL